MKSIINEFHSEINRIAYSGKVPFKALAAELDTSVSELSRRLGNDSLPLRFNDCIKIMLTQNDFTPLDILLRHAGYERKLADKTPTELTAELIEAINYLPERLRAVVESMTRVDKV